MAQALMAGSHNLFGAIIFFSYIAAALTVTGTIVYDLWSLHSSRPWTARRAKHGRSRLRMQSSIVMTLLSFSTLSYHMLCFLIDSYLKWSIQTKTAAPSSIQGDGSLLGVSGKRTETQIWRWATSSTLFQDFAEAIVDNPKAYFWTEKALLYSFVWNCYMAEKGLHLQVPRLWAYFVINQILPLSFSQNLFQVACQLLPDEEPTSEAKSKPPQTYRLVAVVVTMAYLQCLLSAPNTVGSLAFFPILFATRLLLLSPLLIASTLQRKAASDPPKQRYGNVMSRRHITTIVFAGWLIMEQGAPWWPESIGEALDALNGNHAVSALGYDLVIGVVSLGVYKLLGRV